MAIYNGRPVSFIAPMRTSHEVEYVSIRYADGMHEAVPINSIQFTQAEKDQLIKNYPSRFQDAPVIETPKAEAPKKK